MSQTLTPLPCFMYNVIHWPFMTCSISFFFIQCHEMLFRNSIRPWSLIDYLLSDKRGAHFVRCQGVLLWRQPHGHPPWTPTSVWTQTCSFLSSQPYLPSQQIYGYVAMLCLFYIPLFVFTHPSQGEYGPRSPENLDGLLLEYTHWSHLGGAVDRTPGC